MDNVHSHLTVNGEQWLFADHFGSTRYQKLLLNTHTTDVGNSPLQRVIYWKRQPVIRMVCTKDNTSFFMVPDINSSHIWRALAGESAMTMQPEVSLSRRLTATGTLVKALGCE